MHPLLGPGDSNTNTEEQIQGTEEANSVKVTKIIQDAVIWSMGAGLIPLPLMDVAAVTAIQMDMIRKICSLYGQDFSEMQAKAWVSTLGGSISSRLVAESAKLLPGVGTVMGGVTMSILSGAVTYGVGRVFVKHFESGGTLMNFDPEKFKSYFKEQLEVGKEFVLRLRRKQSSPKEEDKKEINKEEELISKLRQLGELRSAGIISEEEFQNIKQKLFSQFS
ncbi:MAG: DUF697 domain-containing protein [Bacteroidia bacterium]|nr:DUF697 domain-containing protein [Bacteroidia bacterium]MDW8157415.1 DUF697 domain-containing protein [Bacteroidia bacterium]